MRPLAAWLGLALACAWAWGACAGRPAPDLVLVWQDEFEGPRGQRPDSTRWAFDIGTDWGNRQLEWDTDRPENASLDGEGNLAITARAEAFAGCDYTSARIKTKGRFERKWGRFEARIKLPAGQGIWPAFWLLGADIDQVGWPACGEIAIMEFLGHEPRTVRSGLHGPGHSGDGALMGAHTLADGGFHLDFHEFAVEWNAGAIVWSVDGVEFRRVNRADLPPGATWVYDHPFFIILNVAVGGRWPGAPDAATVFPRTMLVDYVRVYGERP